MTRVGLAALLWTLAAAQTGAQAPRDDLQELLNRVSMRVSAWFSRAESIVSSERVWIQRLRADMNPLEPARYLDYELRVEWDPEDPDAGELPDARVVRQLLEVNGRRPRPGDDAGCLDPKSVSTEPLSMLLPALRSDYEFAAIGSTTMDGRDALMVAFRGAARQVPDVQWEGDCVSVSLPGWTEGRLWVDAVTYDVMRLDERLTGQFGFDVPVDRQRRGAAPRMIIERSDSSIRYKPVEFHDPTETLMLPSSIETFTIIRGGGVQRNWISQRYSGHRRFLGEARVVPTPAPGAAPPQEPGGR